MLINQLHFLTDSLQDLPMTVIPYLVGSFSFMNLSIFYFLNEYFKY